MRYCRILFTPSHFEGVEFPLGVLLENDAGAVIPVRASKYPSKKFLGPRCYILLRALLEDFDKATALSSMSNRSPHAWAEETKEVPEHEDDPVKWVRRCLP